MSLRKIPKFHLISCSRNFIERHSFHTRKLGETSVFTQCIPSFCRTTFCMVGNGWFKIHLFSNNNIQFTKIKWLKLVETDQVQIDESLSQSGTSLSPQSFQVALLTDFQLLSFTKNSSYTMIKLHIPYRVSLCQFPCCITDFPFLELSYHGHFEHSVAEAYLEPSRASTVEHFCQTAFSC